MVNQRVAGAIVARLGYQVDLAENGLEALEAHARQRYAAVLMDVQMPVLDGYEATAVIRARERLAGAGAGCGAGAGVGAEGGAGRRRTPVIALTANALAGDRQRALDAGMDDHLAKPLRAPDLEQVLRRWLGDPGPAVETPPVEAPADQHAGLPPDVVDRSVLASLRGLSGPGAPSLLDQVVPVFGDEAVVRVEELSEAVAGGDAEAVARLAHRLRGSSAAVGAVRVSSLCSRVEQAAQERRLDSASELVEVLEAELELAVSALRAELDPSTS